MQLLCDSEFFSSIFFPSYETAEALVSCFCSTLKTCAIQKCINHATVVVGGVLFFITTAPATQMSEHTEEQQHPRHKRCKCTRTRAFPFGACLHKHSRLFLGSNKELENLTSFLRTTFLLVKNLHQLDSFSMFFKANTRNQTDQTNQMKEKIVYLFV